MLSTFLISGAYRVLFPRFSLIAGVKSDPATILGHHHSHHQLPPPEFADLPQNNATLPRPPPPPKISKANINTLPTNQMPENQPLLSTHSIQLINTGTLTKKNTQMNSKQNVTMEELRVWRHCAVFWNLTVAQTFFITEIVLSNSTNRNTLMKIFWRNLYLLDFR